MSLHTPGPWRWELNQSNKHLSLVGGKPQFDLTIISPTRWGMASATLLVRDTSISGMNVLHRLHERNDWVRPFPGRAHHVDWCAAVKHPDMQLIEAAPDLLDALRGLDEAYCRAGTPLSKDERHQDRMRLIAARAAIAKATGEQP